MVHSCPPANTDQGSFFCHFLPPVARRVWAGQGVDGGRSSRSIIHGNEEKLSVLFEVVSDFLASTPQGKWPWPRCVRQEVSFLAGDSGTCVIFWVVEVLEEYLGNTCASSG